MTLENTVQGALLAHDVRPCFRQLYKTNGKFRALLASVGNADAVTGNHMFDRYEAVNMIKDAAEGALDQAKLGHIYQCVVELMREEVEVEAELIR